MRVSSVQHPSGSDLGSNHPMCLSARPRPRNRSLDVRYRGRGLQIHCICFVSSSVPDTIDTEQAVSGASGSRYSGYRLYLAQFQIQWIRI